jgi:hypothetical protein
MQLRLSLENFKAFADRQEIPIRPLTLIFGANSAGKSSVLQSLLLAHHGMGTNEYDVRHTKLGGDAVDLGGLENLVYKHDRDRVLTIGLAAKLLEDRLPEFLNGSEEEKAPFRALTDLGLALRFTVSGAQRALRQIDVTVDERLAFELRLDGEGTYRAHLTLPLHPRIREVLEMVGRYWRARQANFGPFGRALSSTLHDAGFQPPAVQMLAEVADQPFRRVMASPLPDSEIAVLEEALVLVFRKQRFVFDKFNLLDRSESEGWHYAGWREQVDGEGLLDTIAHGSADDQAVAEAVRHNLVNLLEVFTKVLAAWLGRLTYLGPLRCLPPRFLTSQRTQNPELIAAGGLAWSLPVDKPEVLDTLNRWLGKEHLRTAYRLRVRHLCDIDKLRAVMAGHSAKAPTYEDPAPGLEAVIQMLEGSSDLRELLFEDMAVGTTVSHCDVGFGLSQVLPILVNAAAIREHLIAVEQPELHLHPAQQAELGDIFIDSALGERKNTFLLETHSEHLILRIMRRMRETYEGRLPDGLPLIRPEDVSIMFVERDGDRSIVREMPLNARGELLKAWPGGFFEEGLREVLP